MMQIVSFLPWTSFTQAGGPNRFHRLLLLYHHDYISSHSCNRQDPEKPQQNPVLPKQHYYKQSVACCLSIFFLATDFILKCHFKSHGRKFVFFSLLSHINYCNAFLLQSSKCSRDARKRWVMILIAQNSIAIPEAEENDYNAHHG